MADARARVPQLIAIETDRAADAAWLERIADVCDRYTPMVALDTPDGLTLDITGCAHLFGGEQALRDDLLSRLSSGLSGVRTAIANTPQAARALARFGSGNIIVAPGAQAEAVAPLPAAALEAGTETTIALRRAGLRTIGDLASRPRTPLAARFGKDMVAGLVRILGEENTAITPRRPLPPCSAERCFAEPVTQMEAILATLDALAHRIAQSLETRGEGGRRFEATLFRVDGMVSRLGVDTAHPTRTPKTVLRLIRERIDMLSDPLDPGYGYDLIRLSVTATAPFEMPQHSLDGRAVDDDDVNALIDRLSTRFGPQAVRQFAPVQTHSPENAVRSVPAAQTSANAQQYWSPAIDERPLRPIHLFERPEPIEALAEIPDGPPLRFRWRRCVHEIARAEGPERIAAEWWRTEALGPTRDYYCVENLKGHRFWVFRKGLYQETGHHPRWFLHGLFA